MILQLIFKYYKLFTRKEDSVMVRKKCVLILVVAGSIVSSAMAFDASKGSLWTGGAFSFQSLGANYKHSEYSPERMNMLTLSPILRIFPSNNICVGPKVSFLGLFSDGENLTMFGIGGEIGVVGSSSNSPYFIVSPGFQIAGGSDMDSENAFELPFAGGVILPVMKNIGMQVEAGLSFGFNEEVTTNTFSISFGICGLGEKTVVSILNKSMPLF